MSVPRQSPYIWATWLPKLLTGESSCEWSVWFKAHHQSWTRPPSDFDQAQWLLNHTALLNEERDRWEYRGYRISMENQNSFRLHGQSATLAGKPDLIAAKDDEVAIIDVKTGREQPWHVVQVMIYMYAVPRALVGYRGARTTGQVVYRDRTVAVPIVEPDGEFVQRLGALIRRLANAGPAPRVPSTPECRFCDITDADCPDRMEAETEIHEGTTADF